MLRDLQLQLAGLVEYVSPYPRSSMVNAQQGNLACEELARPVLKLPCTAYALPSSATVDTLGEATVDTLGDLLVSWMFPFPFHKHWVPV